MEVTLTGIPGTEVRAPQAAGPSQGCCRQETVQSVGFLALRGDEKLFALDGQHRLAGIKRTIKDGIEQDPS